MNQLTFKEVKIGTQVWMAENLNVSTFKNGDLITEAKTAEEWKKAGENQKPACCYYKNSATNYREFYGLLYNWYAVIDARGLAPQGYHIPTDAEWTTLTTYLGGEKVAVDKMKSTSGWYWDEVNRNGTNSSGFNGLPGGYRSGSGTFCKTHSGGYWWSSTELSMNFAWNRSLENSISYVYSCFGTNKGYGFSVRCLRD